MGAHSRPRKGFNKTMALAIAAGVAVSGGVQIAAPAGSVLAAPAAHAAEIAKPQGPLVAPSKKTFHGGNYGNYDGGLTTQLTRIENGVGYYDALVSLPNYTWGYTSKNFSTIFKNAEIDAEINRTRPALSTYTLEGNDVVKVNPKAKWGDWVYYKFESPVKQGLLSDFIGNLVGNKSNPHDMKATKTTSPGRRGSAKAFSEPNQNRYRFTLDKAPRNPDTSVGIIIRDAFTVDFNNPNFDPQKNPPMVKNTVKNSRATHGVADGRISTERALDWVKKTDADQNTPKGRNLTVTKGDPVPAANTAITNLAELKNVASVTWKTTPNVTTVGKKNATVKVTYKDKSVDEVPVTIDVVAAPVKPTPKEVTIPFRTTLPTDPSKVIQNIGDMPKDVVATPKKPNTAIGEPGNYEYVITYPSDPKRPADTITVPVKIGPMADAFDPKGRSVKTTVGKTPSAQRAIVNVGDLPDGTTYTWEKTPDTSKPGTVPATVVVTYPDESIDKVNVNVIVGATDAAKHDPKPKPLTVNNGEEPKAADGIDNKGDMPDGTTYEWKQAPNTSKPGRVTGIVNVIYPDGSTDEVSVPVTVRPIADNYNPKGKDIDVPLGAKAPAADTAIANKGDLPDDATYAWKAVPKTDKRDKVPATVVVTYKDGSKDEVAVTVNVTAKDAEVYTPTAKPITTGIGAEPNPADGIGNKNELPDTTKYTWKTKPDTSKAGDSTGVILVTYPDDSTDEVRVPVKVLTNAQQYTPKPNPIEAWTGDTPKASDGIANKGELPKGTKYTWEKKPDTSKPGDTSGVVKVTYPDGSVDRVTVPVRVFLSGDDYKRINDEIAAIADEIIRLEGEIGKLKGDVNTLKGQMKKAQDDIKRLQGQVKDLEGRMKAAEKRLDGHDKDIADLKRRMADAERRLDNIDKQIAQIMAELERLDGNEIVEGVRNADNSITLVKKDGRTVEIAPATKYGLEKCTAQLGGGLMALVPTLIVLSQAGNAVQIPGFQQQMANVQKQIGMFNPQVADFVAKNGPALAAGAVGLAVIGTMFIPGTCGSDSIADALGESLRGNPNAANPNVRETHDFKGPRFVPKPGTEGENTTAGSSLPIGKDAKPTTPDDAPADKPENKPADKPSTAEGAPAPIPVIDNDTADVLDDLAALAELDNDTEDFDLAVADAFAAK